MPRCATYPSGYAHVNRAWMWGALIATNLAGWLHQLTAIPDSDHDAAHRSTPLLGLVSATAKP